MSQQLGIKLVYDLRSAVEIVRGLGSVHGFPLREWEGSERRFVPVFLDQDYSPEALAIRYKNYASETDEASSFSSSLFSLSPLIFTYSRDSTLLTPYAPLASAHCSSCCKDVIASGVNYSRGGPKRRMRLPPGTSS